MLKNPERMNICQHFKHHELSSKNNGENRKEYYSALGKNKRFKHISIFFVVYQCYLSKILEIKWKHNGLKYINQALSKIYVKLSVQCYLFREILFNRS